MLCLARAYAPRYLTVMAVNKGAVAHREGADRAFKAKPTMSLGGTGRAKRDSAEV